jgi:CelD/BcsL family acetyltransferase involved in cellulose biosynthesis
MVRARNVEAGLRFLDGPPAGWSDLLVTAPAATPAHRPAFWETLAAVLPGLSVRCLAIEVDGALAGGMPVLVERRAGFHTLHALPFTLPGTPLAHADAHAAVDAAAGAGLGSLQRELRAIGGEWALYRPGGPPVAQSALEPVPGETRWQEAALVALTDGLEAAWARVDRKSRKEIRQAGEWLICAQEPDALEEAYALHVAQSRVWRTHRPLPLELSRRLLRDAGDGLGPVARLFTARRRGALVCATLVLDHPREAMPWWSGADPEARRLHAFPCLLWSVVEWAHGAGRARVNLGASGDLDSVSAFKDSLGARMERYPVRWLDAASASAPGRALAALQRSVRVGRSRGETS